MHGPAQPIHTAHAAHAAHAARVSGFQWVWHPVQPGHHLAGWPIVVVFFASRPLAPWSTPQGTTSPARTWVQQAKQPVRLTFFQGGAPRHRGTKCGINQTCAVCRGPSPGALPLAQWPRGQPAPSGRAQAVATVAGAFFVKELARIGAEPRPGIYNSWGNCLRCGVDVNRHLPFGASAWLNRHHRRRLLRLWRPNRQIPVLRLPMSLRPTGLGTRWRGGRQRCWLAVAGAVVHRRQAPPQRPWSPLGLIQRLHLSRPRRCPVNHNRAPLNLVRLHPLIRLHLRPRLLWKRLGFCSRRRFHPPWLKSPRCRRWGLQAG